MALAHGILFGLAVILIIIIIFRVWSPPRTHVIADIRAADPEKPGFRKCGLCTDLSPCDTCGRHAAVAFSGQAAILGSDTPDIADDFERVRSCNQRCGVGMRSWSTNGVESRAMCFPGGSTAISTGRIPVTAPLASQAARGSLAGRSADIDLAAERKACSCFGDCRCGINVPSCGEIASRDGDETTWDMLYGNNVDFRSATLGDVCEYVGLNGYRYKTACSY